MTGKTAGITDKMVLGTVQFGMNYGIANLSGKPDKGQVFAILELAWREGVRCFDTAPGYGSESLLGDFITAHGLEQEAILLTKFSELEEKIVYQSAIKRSIESSLKKLGCNIEVLFFHDPTDSGLLLKDAEFFKELLKQYPINLLGVSVYEPAEVERLATCELELAFQFPFNVLDRRFEKMTMPNCRRYARSIFLQGLLASANGLRTDAPTELIKLKDEYHEFLTDHDLDPVNFAVSYVMFSDTVDYFLIGVDSKKQLQDLFQQGSYNQKDTTFFDLLSVTTNEYWFDPRNWSNRKN